MKSNNELHSVDAEIYQYLNLDDPKSFLLFAGAGSGKTRTLVNVLQEIKNKSLQRFIQNGQRIAVITYTNAACEEIQHRLNYDPIFMVSTIHSFIWNLIKPFNVDIKLWLEVKLSKDIEELIINVSKAKDKNGKTALQNSKKLESKKKRLNELSIVTNFTYSPNSIKQTTGSLNHAEVISIGAEFITNNILMKKVLVNRFPILLIDESQDTNKSLLEAFIATQQYFSNIFALGLFGDLMQRIYSGGKEDLDKKLPVDWKTPEKNVNYRCPKRVVSLINSIRAMGDGKQQVAPDTAPNGTIHLFVVDSSTVSKKKIESFACLEMSKITNDENWINNKDVKTLTLEHSMAANRGEFSDFYFPLAKVDSLKDSVLNGTSSTIKFITEQFLPIIEAIKISDEFETTRIIKKYSQFINATNIEFINSPIETLNKIEYSVNKIKNAISESTTLRKLLVLIDEEGLLQLPDNLQDLLIRDTEISQSAELISQLQTELSPQDAAWDQAINASLKQVKNYSKYISEELNFATHQGVKGLEFDRVMVIVDDDSAKGFLFNYEKLFGVVELSTIDIKNKSDGKDCVMSRTSRLFYVICSRAVKSLAVVAYTKDPNTLKGNAIRSGWFNDDEITIL
jgi:DNA helicase-2/ATP-dependent DNA helicase PcrA